MDFDNIPDESNVILILHLRGLKIHKSSFLFDIYVSQIKVFINDIKQLFPIEREYLRKLL